MTERNFQLDVEPKKRLLISGDLSTEITTTMRITNKSDSRQAFKVKCSRNDLFRIRPAMGTLDYGQSTEVLITYKFSVKNIWLGDQLDKSKWTTDRSITYLYITEFAAREMEVPYSTISKFILRIENRENILELLGRSEQLAEEKSLLESDIIHIIVSYTIYESDPNRVGVIADGMSTMEAESSEIVSNEQPSDREDRLETFLWSLKTNVDSITLPIDVGQFYASFVLKKLPPGVRIDLKKTSYKKFTNFLKAMSEEHQLIKIVSKKGLDNIQEKLIDEQKRVELDDTLQMVIRHFLPDRVPLNELVQKLVPLMTKCWTIKLNDGRTNVRKIKMPTIVISVHFIGEELQNEYGIQKKYIKGLELAIKPKKSKR
ncbi:Major sperm protein [Aphelenchoides besseyi]|nr:Major sperm protein [Aphelenchoides besseyi]